MPNITSVSKITMMLALLDKELTKAKLADDNCVITTSNNILTIEATNPNGSYKGIINIGERLLSIRATETFSSPYNVERLHDAVKASKEISETCILSLPNKAPLKIDFKVEKGYLRYFLAPRMEG